MCIGCIGLYLCAVCVGVCVFLFVSVYLPIYHEI